MVPMPFMNGTVKSIFHSTMDNDVKSCSQQIMLSTEQGLTEALLLSQTFILAMKSGVF